MKADCYVVAGNFYLKIGDMLFTDTEINRARQRFERFTKNKETFRFYGVIEINGEQEVELPGAINEIFYFLEKNDYGYSADRQETEALFWERFFDYFRKLQKTEQSRILNQLSDLIEE